MILTIDLGNTSLKLGVFENYREIAFSVVDNPIADYKSTIMSFLYKANLREDDIEKTILACVVPSEYERAITDIKAIFADKKIYDIKPEKDYGFKIGVPNPDEVGDDIIVMSALAHHLYQKETIIVSVGSATVLVHVTAEGEFKHCIIAPGFIKMAESLWKNIAHLPELDIKKKNTFLANTTVDCMNVGIYNGYIGMVAFLVAGMKRDIGKDCYVIGCGGLGKKIVPYVNFFDEFDPDFVTKGLNYICETFENE